MTSAFTDARVAISGLAATNAALEAAKPDANAEWIVGTDVEYSVYVEFGTSEQQAQPYLRPALRQAMREADTFSGDADNVDELVALIAQRTKELAKDRAPVDTGRLRNSISAEEVE